MGKNTNVINHMSKEKTKKVPGVPEGVGNTKQPPTKWWCFTFNNYSEEDLNMFQDTNFKYVFQKEIGESGNEHLQGTVQCFPKKRFKTLKNQFNDKIHWEKVKDIPGSIAYCCDPSKRKEGTKVYTNMRIPKPLKTLTTLRPWQEKLWQKLKDPCEDDRTINWYWDSEGNLGKSAFARWMCIKHQAFYICGSAKDMKCGLALVSKEHYGWMPELIILDIPRDSKGCSYKGLEQIKNGIFFSPKYEGGMFIFNPPHILVFSNEEPDNWKMSIDRWNIVEIDNDVGILPKE